MKTLRNICAAALLLGGIATLPSCTDLTEEIHSQVTADNYYNNGNEVLAAMMRPWGHFCGILTVGNAPWLCNELSADAAAWPQKGRHGYDNGDWIRLHRHQWVPTDAQVVEAWRLLFMGIGLANNFLADIDKLDFEALQVPMSKAQAQAEMRVYRAYCYWYVMDMFGTAPVVEKVGEPNPSSWSREEMFAWIEKELKESIPALSESKTETYGRVSKWGAYALLARLYLNAEVYTGKARWDDCIAACDELEKGGFTLDSHWNDPFRADNDKRSGEIIWSIVFDQVYAKGFGWNLRWLHYAHQRGWGLESGPWNGLVTQPTFYDSFTDNDLRKTEGFLIGKQYPRKVDENGNYYFDTTAEPLKGSEEYNGEDLVLVNYIKSMTEGEENSGARSIKYEIEQGASGDMNNDWVMFRYSEVLFNKAEALVRKNGGQATQEVVDLINRVRQRSFKAEDWDKMKYTVSSLTMDELLAERGREFAFEGFRRMDLVRFNKFVTTSWWDKEASNEPRRNIFPIPQKQLDANENLVPNEANSMF